MRKFHREILAELKRLGIDASIYEPPGGRHPRIYLRADGVERYVTVAGTPGDSFRGIQHVIARVRRELEPGVRQQKSTHQKRQRTKVRTHVPPAPHLTIRPDPFAALASTPMGQAAMHLQLDDAWRALWAEECQQAMGTDSITDWFRISIQDLRACPT